MGLLGLLGFRVRLNFLDGLLKILGLLGIPRVIRASRRI